jgi:Peptidase M15
MSSLDWSNPESPISAHFTVHDALFLPSWGVYHIPSDQEKANILDLASRLEMVREYLEGNPINVNCWIRPTSVNCDNPRFNGKSYNQAIGGAQNSAHISGMACDFTISRMTCDDVRHLLEDQLEAFGLRMEKKPGSNWVHLDSRQPSYPNGNRYFIP